MNLEALKKLNFALYKRWDGINEENSKKAPLADNGRHIINAHIQWHEICDSLGIERLARMGEHEFHHHGEMLEKSVVVMDPALYGTWLEISNDTAEKILALGLP